MATLSPTSSSPYQTHVIAAVAAGVVAGGLSPQLARAEAESATYLSMALAENAIVIVMFVEDHLHFQCQLFNALKLVSGTGSPVSSVFSFGGQSLSLEKDGGENVIYRRASSSSSDAGGLPLDVSVDYCQLMQELCKSNQVFKEVLASMADANGQISAASMERLIAAAAVEPYESVRCAFISYGSCASDLASGWKCYSCMWYGIGLPFNPRNFSGGGSGFEKWSLELENDDNGD